MLITYREVFLKEPRLEDLHSILKKYRRKDVIAFLGTLNCLLGTWRNEPQIDLDRELSNDILSSQRERLEIIRKPPIDRAVFSRLTLLYVVKQSCIACTDDGLNLLTAAARNDLGICCLMANDLALPFMPSKSDNTLHKLANLLPFTDYVSTDHYPMEIASHRNDLRGNLADALGQGQTGFYRLGTAIPRGIPTVAPGFLRANFRLRNEISRRNP
jgi:hypothetical protein